MDRETAFYFYKEDFLSAYRNNGKNIELAFHQVSMLRDVEIDYLRNVLRDLVNELKTKNNS